MKLGTPSTATLIENRNFLIHTHNGGRKSTMRHLSTRRLCQNSSFQYHLPGSQETREFFFSKYKIKLFTNEVIELYSFIENGRLHKEVQITNFWSKCVTWSSQSSQRKSFVLFRIFGFTLQDQKSSFQDKKGVAIFLPTSPSGGGEMQTRGQIHTHCSPHVLQRRKNKVGLVWFDLVHR